MKTARERAAEWLINNIGVAELDEIDGLEELINSIRKEQDKITRHACAEAVCPTNRSGDIGTATAYRKCMNVKAV